MIRQRRGSIVNFSGGGAASPFPCFSSYAASKAAVVRFTETLAEEVKEYDIRVNAIAPGLVDTSMQSEVLEAGENAGTEYYLRIKRLREEGEGGVPRELAAALVVDLASDRFEGLTGKLVSAPHDDWRSWDRKRVQHLMTQSWFTLRRIDEFTLRSLRGNAE
jgi:3-oxoacyl-[acyl-carrier protein] reductase